MRRTANSHQTLKYRATLQPFLRDKAAPKKMQAKPNHHRAGLNLLYLWHSPACGIRGILRNYLIAPIVRPRTSWRETIRLKIITGKTIIVPVAMIWPQGSS
jgi:hypothetical protein